MSKRSRIVGTPRHRPHAHKPAMGIRSAVAAAVLGLVLLAGCGQKGPLYIPQSLAPATTPVT